MIPKISVIIPVYNTEKYLKRCIESVLVQTFKEYEVILINDGSTDKSRDICNEYANNFENIKVINKLNGGPSDTRNVGIKNSNCEYIYFLDSDDYIIPECLEILYNNLILNNADLSCGNFSFFDDDKLCVNTISKERLKKYSGRSACNQLLYGREFYTSSCNILIKNKIAKDNLFPIGKYHEDEMTTFKYLLASLVVVKTNIRTYYYYQRESSIMHSYGQQVRDEILAGDYYIEFFKYLDGNLLKAAQCKKYFLYSSTIENYPLIKEKDPKLYMKVIKYLKKNSWSIILDIYAPLSIKRKALKYILKKRIKYPV